MGCTHRTVLTRVCLLVGLLGVFWFPLPVSAQTHRLDTDESPTLVALGLAVDLEVTERGDLGQRTIIDLTAKGSSNYGHAHYRCVSWSRGALVLAREEPAPAGMVQREYRLHNPLDTMEHRIGVDVGPLLFGPVRLKGAYRRLLDPSAGGVVPVSVRERSGAVLDVSREPSSWNGIFLKSRDGPLKASKEFVGPVRPLSVGAGFLHNPERARLLLSKLEFSPYAGRLGGLVCTAGSVEALTDNRPHRYDPLENPWIHKAVPVRAPTFRSVGVSWVLDRGGYGDALWPWDVPVFLFAEGWHQCYSWRPGRVAGSFSGAIGSSRLRFSTRCGAVEPGYLDVDMTATQRHIFAGIRLEGDVALPERKPANHPGLRWRYEYFRERGWDSGHPAHETDRKQTALLTFRSGGWVQRFQGEVEGTAPWLAEPSISVAVDLGVPRRFRMEDRLFPQPKIVLTHRCSRGQKESSNRTSAGMSLKGRFSNQRPWSVTWKVTRKVSAEHHPTDSQWDHSVIVDVPVGRRVSFSLRLNACAPGTPRQSWNGVFRAAFYNPRIIRAD